MNDAAGTPVRRRKSPGARKALIAGVVVALAGGGWYGWKTYKAGTDKEGEYLTAQIERGDIEDLVTSTGTLQPREFVDVGAQVSGQIQKIFVEVGDVVEKGDVLAEIDATTAEAKVDQMRAQLLSAVTGLEDSKNNLEKAERDALRQKNLLEADATTKEAKLNADTALITAQNRIKTQEANIEVPKAALRIEERNLGLYQDCCEPGRHRDEDFGQAGTDRQCLAERAGRHADRQPEHHDGAIRSLRSRCRQAL